MKPQLTILANGMTVVSHKNPASRLFNIGIWGRYGSRHETPAQNGIAHFFEHMTFKGTVNRSELEINEQIADVGGKSNAWTDMDTTVFALEVMNEDREFAVSLLSDLLLNSSFSNENINSEREVIYQEIFEDENDKDDCFNDAFSKLVYGNQALGHDILGTPEILAQIGRKELLDWQKQKCCGENLIISAAGNFEHEELLQLVKNYFGSLDRGQRTITEPQQYVGGFQHINPYDSQIKFELGFNLLASDTNLKREAKYLLMQILGGEEVSRLNTEVRIKRSLVYDINCCIYDENDVGFIGITACSQAKNVNRILDVVADEIKKLKNELVTRKELERAKRQITAAIIKKSEVNEDCIEVSAEQLLNFDMLQDLDGRIAKINSVTPEDIRQTARAIFSTKPTYLVQGRFKSYYPYEKLCELLK